MKPELANVKALVFDIFGTVDGGVPPLTRLPILWIA
jgi:hypothetical protein